jgi:hypothetical protein
MKHLFTYGEALAVDSLAKCQDQAAETCTTTFPGCTVLIAYIFKHKNIPLSPMQNIIFTCLHPFILVSKLSVMTTATTCKN